MHAFEFTEKPDYIKIARVGFNVAYASPDFAHWLIDKGLLHQIVQAEASDRDLVFYFDQARFKHAGVLLANGRVISKWGTGNLYEHQLFEVPECYGTEVRFFEHLPYQVAYRHFACFAAEKGVLVEDANP